MYSWGEDDKKTEEGIGYSYSSARGAYDAGPSNEPKPDSNKRDIFTDKYTDYIGGYADVDKRILDELKKYGWNDLGLSRLLKAGWKQKDFERELKMEN